MKRIIGREGGYPEFEDILDPIVDKHGTDGADCDDVLKEWCPKYRLHYSRVDEDTAKLMVNANHPILAVFSLPRQQMDAFEDFYEKNPQGVLTDDDLAGSSDTFSKIRQELGEKRSHAVVLMAWNSEALEFMNSWGPNWANEGYFKVKDASVLKNVVFYDVYWLEEDLTVIEMVEYVSRDEFEESIVSNDNADSVNGNSGEQRRRAGCGH